MAIWLRRLSIIAVLGFPVAVIGKRLGLFQFGVSFSIIQYSFFLAVLIAVVSLVVWLRKRKTDTQSSGIASSALLLSLLPIIGLGSQIVTARSVPMIHNISTDLVNPPSFNKVIALRGDGSNPHIYDASKLAEVQTSAYPNIKTHITDLTAQQAFDKAVAVVKELGWEIVSEDSDSGIIEATETTLLWAFKDDVVIRINQANDKTAVDLRSVSRVGRSDLGANANRIEKFIELFQK